MSETKVTLPTNRPKVELIGRDGNAFAIMRACEKAAQKAGWTAEQQEALLAEMMEGDYDHMLGTALKYFTVTGSTDDDEEEDEEYEDDDYVDEDEDESDYS